MSYEAKSSLQKFESFIKRLQSGINKGLDGELVASKIKEVEVKKEEEVEVVLLAFTIKEDVKTMIPTIAIKLEQFEEDSK
jgi:hypothetical protein